MQLSSFQFRSKYVRGKEVFDNNFLHDLRKIICQDKGVFDLANRFFYIYSKNEETPEDAKKSLLIYKDIILIEADYAISSSYNNLADELINFLLPLFQKGKEEYSKIRNQYIELLTLYWKSLPGKYSKVYIEPTIIYKGKKCFSKAKYSSIKCDIVHIDRKNKCFEMYECKSTMKAFLAHLTSDERLGFNNKNKRKIAQSKRKQNYLSAFYYMLKHKVDELNAHDVAYITLAPKSDLYFNNSNTTTIGAIRVYTKEFLLEIFEELATGLRNKKE